MQREKRVGGSAAVKHGSARVALAAVAAVVIAALVAAWLALRAPPSAGSTGPHAAPVSTSRTEPVGDPAAPDVVRADARAEPAARPSDDRDRFRGRGRIRGEVVLDGVEMPTRWTLVLEPDVNLVGSQQAERRSVQFEKGERRFAVEDLPLGGYRVLAVAPALNSTRASVLLVQGSTDVFVTLRLARAGLVDGIVLDDMGRAAEGLEVTLESKRTKDRVTVVVDATGAFVANGIVDGDWTIAFGPPDAPLLPLGSLTFRAPTLRWRETRLPPTGTLRVVVRDARGSPILDAAVEGSGSPRGIVRGQTGADGALLAPYLLPGRYEVRAKSPDGRAGRAQVDVAAGARADAAIVVE